MNFLIIGDAVPFPPYNGKELPAAKLFEHIGKTNRVDLLVLSQNIKEDIKKSRLIPSNISLVNIIPLRKKSSKERIFQQFAFWKKDKETFIYDDMAIKGSLEGRHYDWLWVFPITYMEFIEHCKKIDLCFSSKIAIGLNDSLTYLYRDSMNELINSRQIKKRYITDWLKSFLVSRQEKKFVEIADIVHVQTQIEQHKLKRIISPSSKTQIIIAPNGTKRELLQCSYKGIDSQYILFMTHLDGGRIDESEWFLKRVWGKIIRKIPEAKLLIVGNPPKKALPYIEAHDSVTIHGYAEDLVELFNSIRIAVVPTFHGTGLINRILDALSAGVPVVSTPAAVATFENIIENEQILSAGTRDEFADCVVQLFTNKEYRLKIAKAGKHYAENFNSWDETVKKIEGVMLPAL